MLLFFPGGGRLQQLQGMGSGGEASGNFFGYPSSWISRGVGKASDPFLKKNYDFKKPVFKAYLNTFFNQIKTIVNFDGLDSNNTIKIIILVISNYITSFIPKKV